MNIKKIAKIILTSVVAGALFTGCGQSEEGASKQNSDIKLGMIRYMNASENQINEYMGKYEEMHGIKGFHHNVIFYDNLNLMLMGLNSKSVEKISTYKCVAKYTIARNENLDITNEKNDMIDDFCFALREDDVELKNSIDKAIKEMEEDNIIDKLIKEYIIDVQNNEPSAVEIAHIDGAQTIKVGVTGDLPPLDLITADGKAAGFNTAVLSEISKHIGKNIELVQIEGGARAAALNSKNVDVLFWAIIPKNDTLKFIPQNVDKPAGIEFSSPYYEDSIVHIALKK